MKRFLFTSPWAFLAGVLCLVAVAGYWTWIDQTWPAMMFNPIDDAAPFDGDHLAIPLVQVLSVGDGEYVVGKSQGELRVEGDPGGLAVGDEITVIGVLRASDRTLVEDRRYAHPLRPAKKALGIGAFFAVILMMPVWYRFRRTGLSLRG